MKPITSGQSGAAVEDVQERLCKFGCTIAPQELEQRLFGPSTLAAVRTFRSRCDLPLSDEIDDQAWICLVEQTYELGDRTLYLRLPYFKGADVSHLQMTLNVLGFSCGEVDGEYGPHTEAAVREFQSNVGLMADGIAFQDTFDAIGRLRHVWDGKTTSAEFSKAHMALARAADVLEANRIVVGATDPIARNVANRMWNTARATTDEANLVFADPIEELGVDELRRADLVLVVATAPLSPDEPLADGVVSIVAEEPQALTQALATALCAHREGSVPRYVRAELPALNRYDGSVTGRVVQNAAIMLLDAVCAVLSR